MIFITSGDPYSINLEILGKALRSDPALLRERTLILCGPRSVISSQSVNLNLNLDLQEFSPGDLPTKPGLYLFDTSPFLKSASEVDLAQPAHRMAAELRGQIALSGLYGFEKLYRDSKQMQSLKSLFCVITLPIDKYACIQAGFPFRGHTEYFGALWGGSPLMTLAYRDVRVALATTHIPVAEIAKTLTREHLIEKLRSVQTALRSQLGIVRPQILVCGLNPHSGDQGAIGREELDVLCPALDQVRAEGQADFIGPVSGDTAFYLYHKLGCDAMLAMYHDQGLAPLKAVYFDSSVNMTLGLKHFRISPDHGPAQDIFGEDVASESSLEECFRASTLFLDHHRPEAATFGRASGRSVSLQKNISAENNVIPFPIRNLGIVKKPD